MRANRMILILGLCEILCAGIASAQEEPQPDFGYDLFHRNWAARDQISPALGDGLGPFFNARSCVACHNQGGSGGGGPAEHDVDLLTLTTIEARGLNADTDQFPPFELSKFRQDPTHPGLIDQSSVVVHRHHEGEVRNWARPPQEKYEQMRERWLGQDRVKILGSFAAATSTPFGITGFAGNNTDRLVVVERSQRNTPALFGAALIDAIPAASLQKLANHQNSRYPEISGRVAPGGGKFGWRGQTATLRQFVVGACANELGLQTEGNPQPKDFVTNTETDGFDMYEEQVTALVNYVRSLEPPESEVPQDKKDRYVYERGRAHFNRAHCNACHVAEIGAVAGIYSDLLLHDMGPGLSDPAALSPSLSSRGYYGTANLIAVSDESKQEWRTPPLWGVRHSAPYLHDSRAETIEAAILEHGGEAAGSAKFFQRLSGKARYELVTFVNSL
ncbi:MAG: hypothetical protein KDA42_11185 [Planctomycetales bacterium]|nr:hypothetical protein [Planctomycetales bacterium]